MSGRIPFDNEQGFVYTDDDAGREAEYLDAAASTSAKEILRDHAEQEFRKRLREFVSAGQRLVQAWEDPDAGFNADERWPLPEKIKPPMSLDEWLDELLAHYEEGDER